jgi:hypothetical protein
VPSLPEVQPEYISGNANDVASCTGMIMIVKYTPTVHTWGTSIEVCLWETGPTVGGLQQDPAAEAASVWAHKRNLYSTPEPQKTLRCKL